MVSSLGMQLKRREASSSYKMSAYPLNFGLPSVFLALTRYRAPAPYTKSTTPQKSFEASNTNCQDTVAESIRSLQYPQTTIL